ENDILNDFLFYTYQIINWNTENTTISRLYNNNFNNTIIDFPTKIEQQIIAHFFNSLDSQIEVTSKKITMLRQLKEASLQSMFPAEGETVPKVRFKGFKGEWEKVKLSSVATRVTRKNTGLQTNTPVTISSVYGIVSQTSFFNNVVASSNLSGYYLIKKGEFAYNKSYSNGYPFGSVKRLENLEMGALSTLYIVFKLNDDVSHDYVNCFFDTKLWHKEVATRAAEGARNHGLLNISAEDFLDIQIYLPTDIAEQQLIASFFRNLDRQINIYTQRLKLINRIKSACLEKMFVQP
ncbi:MAG: restriction endonuclease subunit S, partial [Prevotella sp.]|nr:restriction endonuclease subunit S [Prevotella sp.]